MNRRNFLRSGSLVAIAAAGLPKAVRSMSNLQESTPVIYRTKPDPEASSQSIYEIAVYHNAIDNFKTAKETEKVITLKVGSFLTSDLTKPATQGEYRYKIKKVEANKDKAGEWIITTKFDKKVSGTHNFNSDYPKNPKLNISKFGLIQILSKEGYILDTVPYPVASTGTSSGSGCFLTTACVQHKQMADDCYPLQQLRSLRDEFMLNSNDGTLMVKEYYAIGPAIVNAIDGCDNKAAIYEYMYQNMILPAVALVAEGKKEEAVIYYRTFVKALAENYN